MSKRGNPDYWKTAGHVPEDRDLDEAAKQRFGVARMLRMRGEALLRRPHPPVSAGEPKPIAPIPIREGEAGVPWRVVRHAGAEPPTEPEARHGLVDRAAALLVHMALAPVRASLSIAEALVERIMWRLEKHA